MRALKILALAQCFVLMVPPLSVAQNSGKQQSVPEIRDWQDKSGRYQIKAKLVVQKGGIVVLEKSDGSRVSVQIALLSQADQDFLKQMAAPPQNPFKALPATTGDVADCAVVVWIQARGLNIAVPGFVYSRNGQTAHVVFKAGKPMVAPQSAPVFKVAIPSGDGGFVDVEGKLTSNPATPGYSAVAISSTAVKSSLSEMPKATVRDNGIVKFVGYEIARNPTSSSVAKVDTNGLITKVFRDRDGAVTGVHASAAINRGQWLALVDESGQLIGLSGQPVPRPRVPYRTQQDNAEIEMQVMPYQTLAVALRPTILRVTALLVAQDETNYTYQVDGQVSDPLALAGPSMRIAAFPFVENRELSANQYSRDGFILKRAAKGPKDSFSFSGTITIPVNKIGEQKLVFQSLIPGKDKRPLFTQAKVAFVGHASVNLDLDQIRNAESYKDRLREKKLITSLIPLTSEVKQARAANSQWVKTQASKPMAESEEVAGPEYELSGLQAKAIMLDDLMPSLVWSADGKILYLATFSGVIRRVSYPEFNQTHRLETNQPCKGIALSKNGLAVLSANGDLLVLDSDNLQVTGKTNIPNATSLAASPESDYAYVQARGIGVVDTRIPDMVSLSTATGRFMSVTRDGKYVFTNYNRHIKRFAANGHQLVYEDVSMPSSQNIQDVTVCADSKYVALQNLDLSSSGPRRTSLGIHFFPVDDFDKSTMSVDLRTFGNRLVEVDPKTSAIYMGDHNSLLTVYSPEGNALSQHSSMNNDRAVAYVPHPNDGSLMIKTGQSLLWARIGDASVMPSADGSPDDAQWLTNAPKPQSVSTDLKGDPKPAPGANAVRVKLSSDSLAGYPRFSTDGERLYCLTKTGQLSIVQVPEFKETLRVDLELQCFGLQLTKEGVLVGAKDGLYLFDDTTLEPKRRIVTTSVYRIAGAPESSFAFSSSGTMSHFGNLTMFDLTSGKVVLQSSEHELAEDAAKLRPGSNQRMDTTVSHMQMTPNGKYLLLSGEKIARFKIAGKRLIFDGVTPRHGGQRHPLYVSSDSKWTCLSGATSDYGTPKDWFPDVGNRATYIFDVEDLSKPKMAFSTRSFKASTAIDPKTGLIYTDDFDNELIVFNADGSRKQELKAERRIRGQLVIASPLGERVLAINNADSTWFHFVDKLADGAPEPQVMDENLRGDAIDVDGIDAFDINIALDTLAGLPLFSADGKNLYTVTKNGIVTIIDVPTFQTKRQLQLGSDVHAVALTKEGLLLAGVEGTDLLDAETLEHKHRFTTSNPREITGSVNSSLAFGFSGEGNSEGKVAVFDLSAKKLLQEKRLYELLMEARRLGSTRTPAVVAIKTIAMAPDGKKLLTVYRHIWRFGIDGEKLVFEEASQESLREEPVFFVVSPDSKRVLIPASARGRGGQRAVATQLYDVDDLEQPLGNIGSSTKPFHPAFDAKTGNVLVPVDGKALILYSIDGKLQERYEIGDYWKAVTPPGGGQVLLLGDKKSAWVQFN